MAQHECFTTHSKVQRNKNIFAAPIDMSNNYTAPIFAKTESSIQFIDNCLIDNFIFASLSDKERRSLIDAMILEIVPTGNVIIQQGGVGDFFYVVAEGQVNISVNGKHVYLCARGGSFGELSLLYNCPRSSTCVANTECHLWKVDQKTFRYMLANNTASTQKYIQDTLRKVKILSDLEDNMLSRVADALTTVSFPKGEIIINKGDVGEVFYILREGTVKIHDIGFGDNQYADQFLGPGEAFGETALLTEDPRYYSCTATSPCILLFLSRKTFESTLGTLQSLMDHARNKRVLKRVPIFANSHFQPYEMTRLADKVEEIHFPKGTLLAQKGQPAEKNLYVIRTGRVVVVNDNGLISDLGSESYFGETVIQHEQITISRETITIEEDTVCDVLTQESIISVIGNVARLGKPLPPVASKLNKSYQLKDMEWVRILGVGTFGKVWLVNHKKTGRPFALKTLEKREIIGHHQVEGVIREKNIMSSLDHPFVVNLISTFQNDSSLYLLIELVQGGELFSVIHTETRSRDGISNNNARFYAACILESLSHLHHHHISYRDLKPENILIDSKGYSVLVDLGFAKIVMDKTYTLCGTPEYLAPEVILSKGHDKGVDYWALGVLIYEMVVGQSPFSVYGSDQVSLFKRIVQVKYSFPQASLHGVATGIVDELAQDMITKLIVRKQTNRYGCLARADMDVRNHPWLATIDTDKLLKRQIRAPWVPQLKDGLDSSHFDSYRQLENEVPSKKSHLSSQQQELFRDF